ncbi:MAG: Crp/Fnr family transcriptional regulator [Flavobacteriales bacterium]|nr:Crp/Fnr family transcriptional regulator [Flavobacteriales bacterium]
MSQIVKIGESYIRSLIPEAEDGLIKEFIEYAVVKEYNAGDLILDVGQYIRSTMVLSKGTLKVYRESGDGDEFLMYYLEPGDACALTVLCEVRSEKSTIAVKADEDAELILVPLEFSEEWQMKYPSWHRFIIANYRKRFEELLTTLDSVVFKALDERLEFYLKRLMKHNGKHINLSHQQIADDLNSTREVISRLLKKLEQAGKVKLHRNAIEIIRL